MKYESYKDSGVEWIGKVPSHWKVMALKHSLSGLQDGTHGTFQNVDSDYYLLSAKNISEEGIVVCDGDRTISESDYKSIISNGFPRKDDILLCCVGTIGRCCIFSDDNPLAFQRSVTFLRANKDNHNKYILYLLNSNIAKCQYDIFAKTSAQSGLYMGDLCKLVFPFPPIHEQKAISLYLDNKCEKLSKAIEIEKNKIELLTELKQTIITNAITKGIKPNAHMKSSGIEWIGDIPEHWEIKRLKYLSYGYKAGPFGSSLITSNLLDEGSILVYTPEHIANKSSDIMGNLYLPDERATEMSQFAVNKDDIIFPIVGTLGRAMIITEEMPSGIINQRLAKFKITNELKSRYFLWLFADSSFYSHYISLFQRGSIIVNLTKEIVGNIPVPIPPISEQIEIANYIDKETKKIDAQISNANRRIELVNELKQSIITEAVTGKVKVC